MKTNITAANMTELNHVSSCLACTYYVEVLCDCCLVQLHWAATHVQKLPAIIQLKYKYLHALSQNQFVHFVKKNHFQVYWDWMAQWSAGIHKHIHACLNCCYMLLNSYFNSLSLMGWHGQNSNWARQDNLKNQGLTLTEFSLFRSLVTIPTAMSWHLHITCYPG